MACFVIRVWLPDRPGALGAVASRIGAVGGDLVGIDILERGGGRAIDELVVELPDDPDHVDLTPVPRLGSVGERGNDGAPGTARRVALMVSEMHQVDGVDVEEVRPAAAALRDPRLDALETAALLVGASTAAEAVEELCAHAARTLGATWGMVVSCDGPEVQASHGEPPDANWVRAFVAGSQTSARVAGGSSGPADVVWAPLPSAGLALVLGRSGPAFRARERRQVAALARIVDTRFRELTVASARSLHPSVSR